MDQQSSTKKRPRFDNNVKALISAFLGALSIIFFIFIVFIGMILGFISMILGIIGLIELRTSEQNGKGMAILGIVTGSITLGFPLLLNFYVALII